MGGAIHKDSAQLTVRHATAVGEKAIGHRCVEQGGAHLLDVHHLHTLPTDREDHRVASHSSSRAEEEARAVASSSRKEALPSKGKKGGNNPPKKTHSLKLVTSEEETVSKSVGISGPAHPHCTVPKVPCCCRLHTHRCRASRTYPKCVTNSSTCQS